MALPELTPAHADGSTKLYGMENFGNTCYCNSILQCLYYTTNFRQQVLAHNSSPHESRLEMPGTAPHAYTAKYEQLLAKKLKEKGKPQVSGQDGSVNAAPPPARPSLSIRNSFFGKFSSQNTPVSSTEDNSGVSVYKARGYIHEAGTCDALSTEQRLIIRKTPDFHDLQLLITRPVSDSASELRNDSSVSSSLLLDPNNASSNTSINGDPGPISSTSSYVVIGIPSPEQGLPAPINPFSANPSIDHRKRSALINGPIVNVDHPFSELSESDDKCLLYSLKDIFEAMAENSSRIGVVSPSYFVKKLKEKNFLFRQANMHHDAHEFCNYLVNETIETLNSEVGHENNWCTQLFQGTITNETKCLSCETVTSKDESFLDLSIDIPPGESAYSLTFSLNNFSKSETLNHQNKFYCNACLSLQEAVKTIKLKKTPEVLVINFKRFKYDDKLDRMVKLFDSISYPLNLRLFNTTSTTASNSSADEQKPTAAPNNDFSLYGLYALVVHIGGGPMHGHYVALCKCQAGLWFLFDDETVEMVDDSYVLQFFGDGPGLASAYMLFYEILDTKVVEDGLDFGINLDKVFNGSDYSVVKSISTTPVPDKKERPSEADILEANEAEDYFPGDQKMTENTEDKSIGRKASILKKTFMIDSKDSDKAKDASANSKLPKSSDTITGTSKTPNSN
ncbi:hypothetical protein JCM33374_g1834 [Metschnikowia sp. JCM 33374]|nr:hypothetical protein JCM33374_g1834 [Metschnikowia sp. JCM 33374]